MSESLSSRTKTISETADSESTENPLIADRWTNNISYRQLVMSSCIGIVQLWWHPYLHDLRRLIPFLFLYNVFSVLFAYPLFYLELALGVVTKKGVLNCWDMAPVARGVGLAMLLLSTFSALSLGLLSAWSLALFVHSFHSFLPWLHCAAAASPACAARHRPLPKGSETPAQSFFLVALRVVSGALRPLIAFLSAVATLRGRGVPTLRCQTQLPKGSETPAQSLFFNFVLHLKRDGLYGGLGSVVSELTVYFVISWILVYFIACKRIYSYSKLVFFKDSLAFFVLVSAAFGVIRLKGATRMFFECEWSLLFDGLQMWREALEYSFIQMAMSQGTLVMLGSYCPKQKHNLANTATFAFAVSKISCTATALILGATHGALYRDYDNSTNIWKGPSSSMVLWADYVARIPGSQFWSALVFFTLFVLCISSTALLVQTIMSAFTGRLLQKITWAFLVLGCLLFCLIGILTLCTQGGMYILDFLMTWPVSKPRTPIVAVVAIVVTYIYGQKTFCENVFFAVGEYPCVFLRICWALSPMMLLSTFLSGMVTWPSPEAAWGWALVMMTLMPMLIFMLFYLIFKFRVRNIVHNGK